MTLFGQLIFCTFIYGVILSLGYYLEPELCHNYA